MAPSRRFSFLLVSLLALLIIGARLGMEASSEPAARSEPAGTPTPGHTATAIPTDEPTATVEMTPTAQPTKPPRPTATRRPKPTSTPEPVSQVLPGELAPDEPDEPAPPTRRGGASLAVPDGTSVVWGGCASDGECHWYNFYWAPTHEAVLQNGEDESKVQHELCHAHQHWTISRGEPLAPSDYDLASWYATGEGQSFTAAVAGLPWPWSRSAVNGLEDFAWTCAYWYLDPAYLMSVSPQRYHWAGAHLP